MLNSSSRLSVYVSVSVSCVSLAFTVSAQDRLGATLTSLGMLPLTFFVFFRHLPRPGWVLEISRNVVLSVSSSISYFL